ncbi:hypothetical protein [Synechococcus sp. CS-197]|uniref:hypothetical protein n=1 Tax=Synechococcus sp. CS-197 TaxID=2847985 RepID=UPI0001525BE3|nr:hypothetical protein [Synechococcus sp. CS-197]MCT0250618.1 hypothetical protein [Synechococcus sp. CS-197]CAK23892.1 Uncharacterized conserved secreted protein [Synechococcus sp. WH 7803]
MLMRLRWLLLMVGVLISTDGQGWSATAWAQSLDELQRQRLITPAVRDVLEKHDAQTPSQRQAVLDQACRIGELSPLDCDFIGRGIRRRRRD